MNQHVARGAFYASEYVPSVLDMHLEVARKRKLEGRLDVRNGGSVDADGGDTSLATRGGAVSEDVALGGRGELPVVGLLRTGLVRAPNGVSAVGLGGGAESSVEVGVVAVVTGGDDVKDGVGEFCGQRGPLVGGRPAGFTCNTFASRSNGGGGGGG